jgi:hypothetical protein
MKKASILTIGLVGFLFVVSPLMAESISFKISYNTASVSNSDLNTWIKSYNSLWNDWQSKWGGQLDGQLDPVNYGPRYEVEIRIPIIFGLSLNLSGSSFSSAEEGTIQFVDGTRNQTEKDFTRNDRIQLYSTPSFFRKPLCFWRVRQAYRIFKIHIQSRL